MYRFIPADVTHIEPLLENITPDVKEELIALKGEDVYDTIKQCIEEADEAWTAFGSEGLICIFGVRGTSILGGKAFPWLLTTTLVQKHKRNFLKGAKLSIDHWFRQYDVLENFIPAGFDRLLKWLKWAGFTVYPAVPVGTRLLHRIEMRK